MNKEQENQFKENIKEIARLELKNSFNNNLMETLNSAFIFKYVDTLEKQSQKYKEVIDKAKAKNEDIKHFVYETYLEENILGSKTLYDLVNKQSDILKEVE